MKPEKNFVDPIHRWIEFDGIDIELNLRLETDFERIKGINHLGLISLVYPLAKHNKFEHQIGSQYVISKALTRKIFPDIEKNSVKIAAAINHIGHLPYTYTCEKAVLVAASMSDSVKSELEAIINFVHENIVCKNCDLKYCGTTEDVGEIHYKKIHKWFSLYKYLKNSGLRNSLEKFEHEPGDKSVIFKYNEEFIKKLLICMNKNDNYIKYKNIFDELDKIDYVFRDLFYFGTAFLDINLDLILSKYKTNIEYPEKKLIKSANVYLRDTFYYDPLVVAKSTFSEKMIAYLLINNNISIAQLLKFNDNNLHKHLQKQKMKFIKKSYEHVFNNEYETFNRKLSAIPIDQKTTDSIKLEKKITVLRSEGLLTYPFENGYFTSMREADHGNGLDIYIDEKFPKLQQLIRFISRNKKHIILNDFDGLISHILNEDNASINENSFDFVYLILKDVEFEYEKYMIPRAQKLDQERKQLLIFIHKIMYKDNHKMKHEMFINNVISYSNEIFRKPTKKIIKFRENVLKTGYRLIDEEQQNDKKGLLLEACVFLDSMMNGWEGVRDKYLFPNVIVKDINNQKTAEYDLIVVKLMEDYSVVIDLIESSVDNSKEKEDKEMEKMRRLRVQIINRFEDVKMKAYFGRWNENTKIIKIEEPLG